MSESQAEAMEQSIPNMHCDRYSGDTDDQAPVPTDDATPETDDAAPATDDTTPATDDATPATDDETPATDDGVVPPPIPDDFWTCLQQKTAAACSTASCTWCDTKGGFGLCMTGPTAESAAHSAWFTCQTTSLEDEDEFVALPEDPHGPADDLRCVMAYLQDATQVGCVHAVDATGNPCEWCSLNSITYLCLTSEQAEMGALLGVKCDVPQEVAVAATFRRQEKEVIDDPYDPSCLIAYVQDSTKDACVAAVDADGQPCEFCTLQGALDMCLTAEQAEMGQQLGITCEEKEDTLVFQDDPYDPSCMLTYLHDQSEAACAASQDANGNACEYCSLQGAISMCLTSEQAQMGESVGIVCSNDDFFLSA